MHKATHVHATIIRIVILAGFVGGLAFAVPANAATADGAPQQIGADQTTPAKHKYRHNYKMDRSPEAMARHVEERIRTLHAKLGITSDQEEKWDVVAQTMRDNEATLADLIEVRHNNAKNMNAIDDLQSYEEITQAHANGIKRLIEAFEPLYDEMSDGQKRAADEAFGRFEGHRGDRSAKKNK